MPTRRVRLVRRRRPRQRADDGDGRQHHAAEVAELAATQAIGALEGDPDEDAAGQAADVPADRDPADHERQPEIEQDQDADVGLERVDPARALLDRRRAHEPEHRARGADRQPLGVATSAPNAPHSSAVK